MTPSQRRVLRRAIFFATLGGYVATWILLESVMKLLTGTTITEDWWAENQSLTDIVLIYLFIGAHVLVAALVTSFIAYQIAARRIVKAGWQDLNLEQPRWVR